MTEDGRWSPRFLAYARSQGLSPLEALERDEAAYPGGKMAGFITWLRVRWQDWAETTRHPRAKDANAVFAPADHIAFDAWLQKWTGGAVEEK